MRSTKRLLLLALPAALLVAVIIFAFVSAQRALNRATDTARTTGQLPFILTTLDLNAPATPTFEPVATPTTHTCGAFFQGELYLAGPTGLSIYAPNGTLHRTLRTGLELPASSIVALTPARLHASSDAQLLLATAGAGLLLLDADTRAPNTAPTLHQLLPTTPDLRDLTTLLPLPTGDLLLGTRHSGVLLFNGTTLTLLRFTLDAIDPARLEVTALASPDSASILIGTRNSGLFYLHAGTVSHADTTSGLPDNQIETIAASSTQAFAGTPLGIAQFTLTSSADSASFRPARILASGLFTHTLALNPAATELTVGTLDQGIQQIPLTSSPHLRNASISFPTLTQSTQRIDQFLAPANSASPLYALADGTLLLRTPSGWTPALPPAPTPATLTDRDISALAFDPTGRLYVGFFDRGLDILDPNPATPIRHLEDDHLFCINRIVLDPTRQTIAAATANGLVLFDTQAAPRQVLTRRDGLISDHISDITFTGHGTTLATPAGLTFLTPTGPESLYAFQGLVNNHVYALASIPQTASQPDRLLAGTLGGLSVLENQTVRRNFTATNSGLKHNWITAVAPLPDGSTLLGTYGAGLLRLTTDRDGTTRFTPIDLPASTPRDLVINPNAILSTPTHVYAGTLDHGLLVYTSSTARWSAITQGLPSLNVTAFATRDNILYVGTSNGLVRIPEARLQ